MAEQIEERICISRVNKSESGDSLEMKYATLTFDEPDQKEEFYETTHTFIKNIVVERGLDGVVEDVKKIIAEKQDNELTRALELISYEKLPT